jgi:hypothetical protein
MHNMTKMRHYTSIYANNVVTFLRPSPNDFGVFSVIVEDFEAVSGLHTGFEKCSANLGRCTDTEKSLLE